MLELRQVASARIMTNAGAHRLHFFVGAFPRPPPDGLPVVLGAFGTPPPLPPPLPPLPPFELLDVIYFAPIRVPGPLPSPSPEP